jgi:CRISPR-associated protein Csm5
MKTHDCYRLHLTPLSPLHIGSGESYEPTHYVIDAEAVLHEFDTGGVMAALGDAERRQLLTIASSRPSADMIKNLQRFFHEQQSRLTDEAVNRIPVLPAIAALYKSRVGQTAQQAHNGQESINRLEIDRCAYHPGTRKPVLYGSSLKGAIRTALLDRINQGRSAHEPKGLHDFQGRLFQYLNERGKLELELDPLRLLQLSDAGWQAPPERPAAQVYLAVNRKKAVVRDQKGQEIRAMGESLYQILESVPGGQYRAFVSQLNLQSLLAAGDSPKVPHLCFDQRAIAAACNAFYRPIIESECQALQARGYLDRDWAVAISNLMQSAESRFRQGQAFLLRVGRHSGAESVTVRGVRKIRIMQGRGQPADQATEARTWWLAAGDKDQRSGLLPFGWVLVEMSAIDADLPEWPELHALCQPRQAADQAFAEREKARRIDYEKRQVQRQAEADAARVQGEEQAARDAAEATRFASLSDNQKTLERELRANMSPANQGRGPGDQLYNTLREILRVGADWDLADRQALQTIAVQIFEHLGIARDNKKRKELLRGLKLTG